MIQIDQNKKAQIERSNRITELRKLLADSDFRMTLDYFNQMTESDQAQWTANRLAWREEIRQLEDEM